MQTIYLERDHIKAARRALCAPCKEVACSKDDAPLLGGCDAGERAAMVMAAALSDFNKHQRAVGIAHDQINFTAAAPGRPIIALHQLQALRLQVFQGVVFGRVAFLFGGCGVLALTYHLPRPSHL